MKKRCKYLIDSTKGWPKELVNGCLQLESHVESLDGFEIGNSLSDFQPSYVVEKKVGERVYTLTINPRVRNGKLVYLVQDFTNKLYKIMNPETNGIIIKLDMNDLGSCYNPYQWDFDTLKTKLDNIDMNDGFILKQAS